MIYGGVVELPITLMDAYMFTYWGVRPEETYRKLVDVLKYLKSVGIEIATILWHVNSIKMRGGKEYIRFIEDIWRLEWLTPLRVVDIAMFVGKGKVLCKVYE
jgi:hypothetical protein